MTPQPNLPPPTSGHIEVYKDKNLAHLDDELDAYNFEETFNKKPENKKKKAKTQQIKSFDQSNKVLTKHFRKFKFKTAFIYALNRWHVHDQEFMEPLLNWVGLARKQ